MLRDYINGEPWTAKAECAGTSAKVFFPPDYSPVHVRLAKQICKTCEVREECLEYALLNKEPEGIWGGLTPYERRKLQRR